MELITIINDGELAVAGEAFLATLRSATAWRMSAKQFDG